MTTPLVGFFGFSMILEGYVILSVTMGQGIDMKTFIVDFIIVNYPSPYNVILGQPFLLVEPVVASTYHIFLKFPIENGKWDSAGRVKSFQGMLYLGSLDVTKIKP